MTPSTTSTTQRWLGTKALTSVLLLLILLAGGGLRFMSLNWDDFASLHPDERFLTRNVLPLLDGRLEFTPDSDAYPSQTLLVTSGSALQSPMDIQQNPALRVGVVEDSLGAEIARLWVSDASRVQAYETPDAARTALAAGEVAVLWLASAEANLVQGIGSQPLTVFSSQDVQRIRCEGLHPATNGAGGYFDTDCSPLNPHNAGAGQFAYGTLPLFMAHVADGLVQQAEASGLPLDYQGQELVWRFLSAFFETGTVLFVFFIGRKLHSSRVGLMAAALYAFAPLAIQLAHFGTVNAITSFFVALALFAAVNVQDNGRYRDYLLFGLAFGCAMAGRINIIPLAGVVVLAAFIYSLPALSGKTSPARQQSILFHSALGVVLAGIASILIFRLVNPYAFTGPTFWHFIPDARFLADASNSSYAVSGASDIPPNWQWLGRIPYLYPLKDMVLWGMGLFTGVLGWVGFGWSGYRIARSRQLALRNTLLVAWVLVYFGWIGNLWVATPRYYIPLYSSLAIFAAWTLDELAQQAIYRGKDVPLTRGLLLLLAAPLGLVPAYYLQAAQPMTVTALVAGVLALVLIATALLPVIVNGRRAQVLAAVTLLFAVVWGLMFNNIHRHQTTRIQASRWLWENIPGDFALQIDGAPEGTPLINIGLRNRQYESAETPQDLVGDATRLDAGFPEFVQFTAPASGTVDSIIAPHIGDPNSDPEPETLYLSIAALDAQSIPTLLGEVTLTQDFSRQNHVLGDSYEIAFDEPISLEAGERYQLKVEVLDGAPLVTGGSVVLAEGAWDDRLSTVSVCGLPQGVTLADDPAPGLVGFDDCNAQRAYTSLVASYDLPMAYVNPNDYERKRDLILDGLQAGDYLTITSNRFYDSMARNPKRFPLEVAYYDALFAGELGYELVEFFDEGFALGSLSVGDQHLPMYDSPAWLNELEADEAFHVYDHPATFIFQKREDYNHAQVSLLLESVPLNTIERIGITTGDSKAQISNVLNWTTLESDIAPTALMMPDDIRDRNLNGGTWSERFDSDSLLNQNQVVGVVIWWLTMMSFGVVVFPLLFAMFPQMGDRGYGMAKTVGLLLVSWSAWFAASLKVQLWSQSGIIITLLLISALSAVVAYRQKEAMRDFLREHWRRLLAIEVISLLLFAFFIGVRLTNPDLWHYAMGGEKPMDFSYFNAVLQTTIFPAYDPWYSGGYLNYYYLGFVVVGSPVLLLKLVPAFAYNLIIPTLFSLTGTAAFSAAFNIVDRWRVGNDDDGNSKTYRRRMGNPWLAGIAAMLLCVVLGNLDTVRVLGHGVASLAGYQRPQGLESYLREQQLAELDTPLSPEQQMDIANRADANYLTDRLAYEIDNSVDLVTSLVAGTGRVIAGQTPLIGSNRWYWAPTRVLAETPGVGGSAITEMPYFTFLYGDLHPHMINLPVMLFAILFVFNEVSVAQRDKRRAWQIGLALALGGMSVGLMRGINTWDLPSFLVLGVVGLGYAWWRRYESFSRDSLLFLLAYVGGFLVAGYIAVRPYAEWYASIYNSVALWEGGKTPLWAYLDIHGLFLFLLVALLLWESGRWLRDTQVRSLAGKQRWLWLAAAVVGGTLLISVILAMMSYQVALIVLPLVLWIAILFFRPGQHPSMQFVLVLAGFALSLTLAVEVVVVAGDIQRQNTVFKFYMQVWVLLSVAGGAAFGWLSSSSDYWSRGRQLLFYVPLALLVMVAAMFPVMATQARSLDRMAPQTPLTLNGLDYMQDSQYTLRYYPETIPMETDYQLIRWLQENVEHKPTIIEGRSPASEYTLTSRIAINTGLPSVLGWNWHQRQQRTLDPLPRWVEQREANVQYFYTTADIPEAVKLLRFYDVGYVIVSDFERSMTDPSRASMPPMTTPEGIAKFEVMTELGLLEVAYGYKQGVIYRVNQTALDAFALSSLAFQNALGVDAAELPSGVTTESNDDMRLDEVRQALMAQDAAYVSLDNLAQMESYAPRAYDRLQQLLESNVLSVEYTYDNGRIYRVNQDALTANMSDEDSN